MQIQHEQLQTNAAGQITYSFDFQNLSGVPVGYLYIVPASNCLTANPDIISFSPPVAPGGTIHILTMLTANGPCPLCFTIAAHTTNLTQCCSVTHCLNTAAAAQPVLAVAVSGTNLMISWAEVFSNYVLECTPRLNPPIGWTQAPRTSVTANGRIVLSIPIGSAPSRFYRLRLP